MGWSLSSLPRGASQQDVLGIQGQNSLHCRQSHNAQDNTDLPNHSTGLKLWTNSCRSFQHTSSPWAVVWGSPYRPHSTSLVAWAKWAPCANLFCPRGVRALPLSLSLHSLPLSWNQQRQPIRLAWTEPPYLDTPGLGLFPAQATCSAFPIVLSFYLWAYIFSLVVNPEYFLILLSY